MLMSRFMNERYRDLHEYVPGEQPKERRYIKLNTNENPYPPSDAVIRAVREFDAGNLKLYPDPDASVLLKKIAETYGVNPENVIVSNGSDDVLSMIFAAFGGKGAAFPDITYGFYTVFASLYDVKYTEIPLRSDYTISPDDYMNMGKLIVIANPNAPTGIALTTDEIERIVRSNPDSVVVIDEAYVDFGAQSAVPLTKKYGNLCVVMTFSKSRSLAGARLGFAVGNEALIRDLYKIKYSTNPYSVNSLTQAIGAAALDSREYYAENCKKIGKTRDIFADKLRSLGFYVTPSLANFVFARHGTISGEYLYRSLRQKGILVRRFDTPRIEEFLRITVGTEDDMETLCETLAGIISEAKGERT